jgi:hypothetical protein
LDYLVGCSKLKDAFQKESNSPLLVIKRIGEVDHHINMTSQYVYVLCIHEGKTMGRKQEQWSSAAA